MFKKKVPPPPPSPAAVQVLTPDYLIQGYLEDLEAWPFSGLLLTGVRFEPVGALQPPVATAARWFLPEFSPVLVAIPGDPVSQARTQELAGDSDYALPAELYVGPYRIQGMVLRADDETDAEALTDTLAEYALVQDASIDCLLPGTRLPRLHAPFVVVRTGHLLQGFVPL